MAAYSFLDVQANIVGPNGVLVLGNGAGAAEEGISYQMAEEKNTLITGADGSPMHSLHAGKPGIITVRLLKTSPYNKSLQNLYLPQSLSSALWGQNTITISETYRGDLVIGRLCAFKKTPDNAYAKDAGILEWSWDVGYLDVLLGDGG